MVCCSVGFLVCYSEVVVGSNVVCRVVGDWGFEVVGKEDSWRRLKVCVVME